MRKFSIVRLGLLSMVFLTFANAWACGPSPQKVTEEIVINAAPSEVWKVINDFSGVHHWHPLVSSTTVSKMIDENHLPFQQRTLHIRAGGVFVQKQRNAQNEITEVTQDSDLQVFKAGIVMLFSDLPISNYSDSISLKKGINNNQAIVTWVGRFSNKANAMQAPIGQDDEAAILAVSQFYKEGLEGLKRFIEIGVESQALKSNEFKPDGIN